MWTHRRKSINNSYLVVRRHPYEEPHYTELEVLASNGSFKGSTNIYCNVSDFEEIGKRLIEFPRFIGDSYLYEYGSPDPKARFFRQIILRAYTLDRSGHCALQVAMNLNQDEPEEGTCRFSIKCEPNSLIRLGTLFLAFARLQHLEFKWVPDTEVAELYAQHQPE